MSKSKSMSETKAESKSESESESRAESESKAESESESESSLSPSPEQKRSPSLWVNFHKCMAVYSLQVYRFWQASECDCVWSCLTLKSFVSNT